MVASSNIVPMKTGIGHPASRVDGRLKVTGQAVYGSDTPLQNPAYAYLATSRIARGRVTAIDKASALAVPGVLDVMTHEDVGGKVKPGKTFDQMGYMGTSIAPLADGKIHHDGQIIAVVLADTYEAAREGANRLKATYAEERPSATFDSPGVKVTETKPDEGDSFPKVGDAPKAFAEAPVKIEARYSTPIQHHNPIELFTTTCVWANGRLTIYEPSQGVGVLQNAMVEQLGLPAEHVRVVSTFVGGAFGSKGSATQRTALIALAAQRLNRPVKLVATRADGFTIATHRAETRHHVKLAAARDGKLQALIHEGEEVSSRPDAYKVAGVESSTRVYACPNIATKVSIVSADRNTPGFMRSPPEIPYMFAMESAMDELAHALAMDPVELRRVNDTMVEPVKGLKFTSRSLIPCFDAASKAFDWSRRNPKPGQVRQGEWLVGLGCATALYPSYIAPCSVRVTLTPSGQAIVSTAAADIGNGAYTVVAMIAAERLGVPIENVDVQLGDSDLPPAPVAGGSNVTASVSNVLVKACEEVRAKIAEAAVKANDTPFAGRDPKTLVLLGGKLVGADGAEEPLQKAMMRASPGAVEVYAENLPHGAPPTGMQMLYKGVPAIGGGERLKDRIQFAFGAQFVEVHVHARTKEVRTPRIVGAYAAGTIINPKTAKSQLMGAQIWGVSAALHEATEIDKRAARYTNTDLAEYMIPVNADIAGHEVIMLPEADSAVNPLGVKGIGELGNVGMNAAVANAVFNATGVRVRDLPIRLENLLGAASAA